MNAPSTTTDLRSAKLPIFRLLLIASALLLAVSSGCSRLRLPAIDPTGNRIFTPLPTTTSLAIPGFTGADSPGQSCLDSIGSCFKNFTQPNPAFKDPADPPACLTPGAGLIRGRVDQDYLPSESCGPECKDGPRAVLLGSEIDRKKGCFELPDRGERGCILLSPQKIVAPVGGEVILLSGICGDEGYLQTGQPIEWMLTPDSVGTLIQIGDDDPGLMHKLVGIKKAEKHDGSFARGVTSTKKTLITRGNKNGRDDVSLKKGQTWVSLSSPNEGVSRITVLAPESECWDQRKATATIHWIDAKWQFPGPQTPAKDESAELVTRVTRADGTPVLGDWRVRYELRNPELAAFAGTNQSSVVEVKVNEAGNAVATLVPIPGASGNAIVDIKVIRPGGTLDAQPVGSGQAFVTWSAPQLELRTGAPQVATYNQPFEIIANVRNPGNQAVNNLSVEVVIPEGARVIDTTPTAQVIGNTVVWQIGTLPAETQQDLVMNMVGTKSMVFPYVARGAGNMVASDNVSVDIFEPILDLVVTPRANANNAYEAGKEIVFDIVAKNNGTQPVDEIRLTATGDEQMRHVSGPRAIENTEFGSVLQAGESRDSSFTFIANESGRRCVQVEIVGRGGQRVTREACVTVINPIPARKEIAASIRIEQSLTRVAVGDNFVAEGTITNTGEVALKNVRTSISYVPQMSALQASPEYPGNADTPFVYEWTIPEIAAGESKYVRLECRAATVNPNARMVLSVESAEGARSSNEVSLPIVLPNAAPPAGPVAPNLPPVLAPPSIPDDPASAAPGTGSSTPFNPAPTGPRRSGQLQMRVFRQTVSPQVNDPITYAITVTNDRADMDGDVNLEFELPAGVKLIRAGLRSNPEISMIGQMAPTYILGPLSTIRPDEVVELILVVSSNQPQTFNLQFTVNSRLTPNGISAQSRTEVR